MVTHEHSLVEYFGGRIVSLKTAKLFSTNMWKVRRRMNNLSYLIKQGIRSVWKNRFMSFASLCIMTVSLILVGMSAIVMLDCGIILDNVSDKNEISVYLNDDADIKHIGEVLKATR